MAVMGRDLQIRTIRARIVKEGYPADIVNVDQIVDSRMDLEYNWRRVEGKMMYMPSSKSRSALTHDRVRKVSTKKAEPRKVHTPKPVAQKPVAKPVAKTMVIKKPASSNAQMRNGTCMIPVAAYERRCTPKTAAKLSARGHR